jgi:diguanylate cyclase (GGDEF)-like protein
MQARRQLVILQYYLNIIRKKWWLELACLLGGWMIALLVALVMIPQYQASATFIVAPNPNLISSRDMVTSLDTLDNMSIISTYADILRSERIYDNSLANLDLNPDEAEIYLRTVDIQTDSKILQLNIEGPDPISAAVMANAIGENSIAYIKGIYQVYDIAFLDLAKIPIKPVRPQPLRSGLMGAGIGLIFGIFLAVIGEQLRASIEMVREKVVTDSLSGAFTEVHFRRLIALEISGSTIDPISLGLISLDGIQGLVEALPEPVQRSLLHTVAETLDDQLRGNDVIGRWGKAGFGLILKATPGSAAARTFERIRHVLLEPVMLTTGELINLEPMIGLTCLRNEDDTANTLIANAEHALELARHSDRHTVFFDHCKEDGA